MSDRAAKFVERWVQDHLGSDAFVNRDGDERPGQLAAACLDAAGKHGIAVAEIDEEFDSLEGYIGEAIDRFAQAEFSRLRTQEPS